MERTPTLLLVLALYCRTLKTHFFDQFNMTDEMVKAALREMQEVTETMDCQIETDLGLCEMAIKFALDYESYRNARKEESKDYHSVYG